MTRARGHWAIGSFAALAFALGACGGGAPRVPIRVPPPPQTELAAAPDEPALPEAPASTLSAVLEVELEAVRARIEAALPRAHQQDWTQVTREGDSPRIELRVFLERDPVQVSFGRGALHVQVPVRYWADVRGAVKSPLPWQRDRWFELERGSSWGTRAEPQRAVLVVHSSARVEADGDLKVNSELDPVDLGAAPAGSFCVKAGIKLCVGKQTFTGEVRDAFQRHVLPIVRDALADLDRRLGREADLRVRLARGFAALQCPRALHRGGEAACAPDAAEQGTWLQVIPERLRATGLSRRGTRVRMVVALSGALRVTRGDPPPAGAAALPAIETAKPSAQSSLHVPVVIPYELLATQLMTALPSRELALGRAGRAKLASARVLGATGQGERARLLLELRLLGDVDAVFQAFARLAPGPSGLAVAELEYTAQSERVLSEAWPDADHRALRAALAQALRVELKPLADAGAQLLAVELGSGAGEGVPVVPKIDVGNVALSDLRLGPRGLAALLSATATLRVRVRELSAD